MAFDRLGDIVVHHDQTGPADAPTLVFVNSLGTDLRVWDALLPKLAAGSAASATTSAATA